MWSVASATSVGPRPSPTIVLQNAMVAVPSPRLSCGRRSSVVVIPMVPAVAEISVQAKALASDSVAVERIPTGAPRIPSSMMKPHRRIRVSGSETLCRPIRDEAAERRADQASRDGDGPEARADLARRKREVARQQRRHPRHDRVIDDGADGHGGIQGQQHHRQRPQRPQTFLRPRKGSAGLQVGKSKRDAHWASRTVIGAVQRQPGPSATPRTTG